MISVGALTNLKVNGRNIILSMGEGTRGATCKLVQEGPLKCSCDSNRNIKCLF